MMFTVRISDFSCQLSLLTHLEIHIYIDAPSVTHILHKLIMLETLSINCYFTQIDLGYMDIESMLQDITRVNPQLQD